MLKTSLLVGLLTLVPASAYAADTCLGDSDCSPGTVCWRGACIASGAPSKHTTRVETAPPLVARSTFTPVGADDVPVQMRMRSPGVLGTGIVFMVLGAGALAAAVPIGLQSHGFAPYDGVRPDGGLFAAAMGCIFGGSVLFGGGLVMVIVGSHKVAFQPGVGSVSLSTTF